IQAFLPAQSARLGHARTPHQLHLRYRMQRTYWHFITLVALVLAAGTLHAEEGDGFKPLFDGKSLEGWDGNPDFWSVRDGAITGQTTAEKPTRGNTFIIYKGSEIGDF